MRLQLHIGKILLVAFPVLGLSSAQLIAEETPQPVPSTTSSGLPSIRDYAHDLPGDFGSFYRNMAGYDWTVYAAVVGTTLLVHPHDQHMVNSTRGYALEHHYMGHDDPYGHLVAFHLMGKRLDFPYPLDLTAFFWYLGDGMFSLELMGAFGAYGYYHSDARSVDTALQMGESLVITAATVMPIKIMTGRESPQKATASGGKWHGYPGLLNYINHQARYYAYPSGHTATLVSAVTVIAENYPEQRWIAPVGGAATGMLMVALMNVGSHWPSDFPLAILIGYTAGHTVASKHRAQREQRAAHTVFPGEPPRGWHWLGMTPTCMDEGCGVTTEWQF